MNVKILLQNGNYGKGNLNPGLVVDAQGAVEYAVVAQ